MSLYGKIKDILKGYQESTMPEKTRLAHIAVDIESYVNNVHVESMKFYTVIAHRYGNEEGHTYLVGSYKTLEIAIAEALEHREHRGGKYDTVIYEDSFDGVPKKVFDYHDYDMQIIKIRNRIDE